LNEFNHCLCVCILVETRYKVLQEFEHHPHGLILVLKELSLRLQKVEEHVLVQELPSSFVLLDSVTIPPFGLSDVHLLIKVFHTANPIYVSLGDFDLCKENSILNSDHWEVVVLSVVLRLEGNTKCAPLLILSDILFGRWHNTIEALYPLIRLLLLLLQD